MIKNIIFDLGNVLLYDNPVDIVDNLIVSESNKDVIKSTFFSNWEKLDIGKESLVDHFNNCQFSTQIDEDTKEKLINYYKYRPLNNDILNIMKSLKDNNYKIYILSDNNIDTYNYLKEKKELSFEMHPLG